MRPALRKLIISLILLLLVAKLWPLTQRIFNWDELGLLSRAHMWLTSGFQVEESRPGLVRILLMPIIAFAPSHISAMYAARLLNFCALLALYLGTFRVAKGLYGRATGYLALLLLSFHSLFFAHSVEIRTETFAMAFVLCGASVLEASPFSTLGKRASLRLVLGWILIALGALSSQKALYPLSWYLLSKAFFVGRPVVRKSIKHRFIYISAASITLIITIAAISSDAARLYLYNLTIRAVGEARTPFYVDWVQWTYIKWSWDREPVFWLAGVPALAFLIRRFRPSLSLRRRLWLSLFQQLLLAFILWFHAARFPYFFITIAPLWAISTAYQVWLIYAALQLKSRAWIGNSIPAYSLILSLIGSLGFYANEQRPELFKATIEKQLARMKSLENTFNETTPTFDAHHLMFRQKQVATPIYSKAVHLMKKHPDGAQYFANQIKDAKPWYYIQSKRTELLPEVIQQVLKNYFVRLGPNTYIAGSRLSKPGTFETLVNGTYRLLQPKRLPSERRAPSAVKGRILIDNKTLSYEETIHLSAGKHRIRFSGAGSVRLRLHVPGIDSIEEPHVRNVQLYRSFK